MFRVVAVCLPLSLLAFGACGSTADDSNENPDSGAAHDGATDGGTCTTADDCGGGTSAGCSRRCDSGTNACVLTCSTTHQCVQQGCPEDSAPSGCSPECKSDELCVRDQFAGGIFVGPDDAGACPASYHLEGAQCVADPTYACAAKPAACGAPFDCSCAGVLCTGGYQCTGTTQHQVNCMLDAP